LISSRAETFDITHPSTDKNAPPTPQSVISSDDRRVATVPVSLLQTGESPRLEGQNEAHVARLAEIDGPLPPILVDRRTMQVIDGTHRLMATKLKGQATIDVVFFDGSTTDAFLHAVEANVTHGFPLSQTDRRAAAERIVRSHPHMSDRAIARVSGLGAKTVGGLRRRLEGLGPPPLARVGKDGRIRPLNGDDGRLRAAEMITEHPHASLREVARGAGVSPATARDVRKRLERGESPTPSRGASLSRDADPDARPSASPSEPDKPMRLMRLAPLKQSSPRTIIAKLLRDPSLRHKERGRLLLDLLRQNAMEPEEWYKLTTVVPEHCGDMVSDLARHYAQLWEGFADALAEREPVPLQRP
jgi:ParB-like chromosome segregation protein Spo0J